MDFSEVEIGGDPHQDLLDVSCLPQGFPDVLIFVFVIRKELIDVITLVFVTRGREKIVGGLVLNKLTVTKFT